MSYPKKVPEGFRLNSPAATGRYFNNKKFMKPKSRSSRYTKSKSRSDMSPAYTARKAWFEENTGIKLDVPVPQSDENTMRIGRSVLSSDSRSSLRSGRGLDTSMGMSGGMSMTASMPSLSLQSMQKGSSKGPQQEGGSTLREAYNMLTKAEPSLQKTLSKMTSDDLLKKADKYIKERYSTLKAEVDNHNQKDAKILAHEERLNDWRKVGKADLSASNNAEERRESSFGDEIISELLDAEDQEAAQQQQQQQVAAQESYAAAQGGGGGMSASAKARHRLAHSIPQHQREILLGHPMYTPDPTTYVTAWPIPGMQGARSPFKLAPWGGSELSSKDMKELNADILAGRERNDDAAATAMRRKSIEKQLAAIPQHQHAVIESFPNYPWMNYPYRPDPLTGISKWPVPGMQGARSPCRHVPFATQEAVLQDEVLPDGTVRPAPKAAAGMGHWDSMKDSWYRPDRDGTVEQMRPVRSTSEAQACSFSQMSLAGALR